MQVAYFFHFWNQLGHETVQLGLGGDQSKRLYLHPIFARVLARSCFLLEAFVCRPALIVSYAAANFLLMDPANEKTRISRLDRLSQLLDSAFRIPGTDFRIGLDAVLGLIPGVGDTLGAVLS